MTLRDVGMSPAEKGSEEVTVMLQPIRCAMPLLLAVLLGVGATTLAACQDRGDLEEVVEEVEDEAQDLQEELEDELDDRT